MVNRLPEPLLHKESLKRKARHVAEALPAQACVHYAMQAGISIENFLRDSDRTNSS